MQKNKSFVFERGRYRIRVPTDKEKEMKVTKEVAAQRYFESAILNGYQKFLQVVMPDFLRFRVCC